MNFVANVDKAFTSYVMITGATLDFGKAKTANLLATLTEQGQTLLASQGELSIPFTVDFAASEGQEDPGFNQLPGTLSYVELSDLSTGWIAEAAAILLGQGDNLVCPIGQITEEQGGNLFSLLTEVIPSVVGTVTTTTTVLDSLGEATTQGRSLTAQAQLEAASLNFKASNKFVKYAKLDFNQGSTASNFSLENVVTTLADADENGNVEISFTADVPALLNYKKGIVKAFVADKDNVTALFNGQSLAEADVDLTVEKSLKAGFKFKKAKNTLFEANKTQKFNVVFTAK